MALLGSLLALGPATRNVVLLALCQGLAMSCNALSITVTALVGYSLAADKSLATLPLALQFVAMVATTIPASLFMQRFGRRAGLSLGAVIGIASGALGTHAVLQGAFLEFCVATLLFGVFSCHAQFYRFAAADATSADLRGRAISLVMAGGLVAAFLGPQLAVWSRDWLAPVLFAGGYLAVAAISVVILLVLQLLRIPPTSIDPASGSERPLSEIAGQPAFLLAALAAMVGYGAMNLVMTATPLAIVACQHPFETAALVIQWHVVGMFAPSFFTGHLIARFGVYRIIALGGILILGCVAVNLSGVEVFQFWSALVLLGLGWNFMFIGGTTLLTRTYRPAEKAKVQALNEFLVFGTVASTALGSGALFHALGWGAVNLAVLAPVAMTVVAAGWYQLRDRRSVAAG